MSSFDLIINPPSFQFPMLTSLQLVFFTLFAPFSFKQKHVKAKKGFESDHLSD